MALNIKDMFDRVVLRSGQFILKRANVEIDIDSFRLLVEDALAIYSKAAPFDKTYNFNIGAAVRQFTFTETTDPELKRIPDWLSEVTPVRPLASNVTGYGVLAGLNPSAQDSTLIIPTEAPWVYEKPVLTVPYTSHYKIIAIFRHWIEKDSDGDYLVPTITSYDNVFFMILQGMFLQGIGRSRRAFTLNDLPIVMDADQIASEGKDLLDEAKEELQNVQKIHLPMG